MRTYEFEGKTTENAIEEACRTLNLSRDEMEVEVIEPGSAGIFGLVGGRKAKIRVSVPDEEESSPETVLTGAGPSAEAETEEMEFVRDVLQNILDRIPMKTSVTAERVDGRISLNIEGDSSGLLIGRKGKTLDALQFIVNKIANKALEKKVHVIIDSENYRQRRKDSLIQLALRLGEKARRIQKPVTTGPLNPHDRRIVHLALRDEPDLDTRSRGEGIMKRVVILPRRSS